jgi:hypothetical protein
VAFRLFAMLRLTRLIVWRSSEGDVESWTAVLSPIRPAQPGNAYESWHSLRREVTIGIENAKTKLSASSVA